jgi:hypothetical protein
MNGSAVTARVGNIRRQAAQGLGHEWPLTAQTHRNPLETEGNPTVGSITKVPATRANLLVPVLD